MRPAIQSSTMRTSKAVAERDQAIAGDEECPDEEEAQQVLHGLHPTQLTWFVHRHFD